MKHAQGILLLLIFLASAGIVGAQVADSLNGSFSKSLEGVIIETYVVHSGTETPANAGVKLPPGSVTYRVYIDLAPGCRLQALYGSRDQELRMETTTRFYNDTDKGAMTGDEIPIKAMNEGGLAFDSWLSLGAAATGYLGIMKEEDSDGSILDIPALMDKDGLTAGQPGIIRFFNLVPAFFQGVDSSAFTVRNGAWTVFEGVRGPTSSNRILIAQLTTDGALSLALNLQVLTPDKKVLKYVSANPKGEEILHNELIINQFITKNYEAKSFTQYDR